MHTNLVWLFILLFSLIAWLAVCVWFAFILSVNVPTLLVNPSDINAWFGIIVTAFAVIGIFTFITGRTK